MTPALVLDVVVAGCASVLALSLLIAATRVVIGPSLPDRVVALDLLAVLSVGLVVTLCIAEEQPVLLDVALVLALITFLGTIAFAQYVERRSRDD